MKKIFAWILVCAITITSAFPCTTFVLKTKNGLYFGRNLDWVSDLGLLIANQRNTSKTSFVFAPEKPVSWSSKYGSITFNQFGKEFPFGGINEKGLVVEVMVSPTEYPETDERPMVNELQWVQYQLDNCATIDEVLATDKKIRIGQAHEGLHYLVCDGNGNVAVIEFIGGKMVYYKGKDLVAPVLENETYETSKENYNNNETCRFVTAADMVKEYKGNNGVEYSFEILKEVALSAEWSVVYDITRKQIHFKTTSVEDIRIVDLSSFNFGCSSTNLSYDMSMIHAGDITKQFSKLKATANENMLKKAMMSNMVLLENEQYDQLINYFKTCSCEINSQN